MFIKLNIQNFIKIFTCSTKKLTKQITKEMYLGNSLVTLGDLSDDLVTLVSLVIRVTSRLAWLSLHRLLR